MKTKRRDKNTKKPQKSQRKLQDLAVKKDVRGGEEISFSYSKPHIEYKP